MAKESMPFELARPDANTPVTNTSEIDHGTGAEKEPLSEVLNNTPKTSAFVGNDFDLVISDSQGNAVGGFTHGEFRTKNFQSEKAPQTEESEGESALRLVDEQGNCVAAFIKGHIVTKHFNSSLLRIEKINNKNVLYIK